MCGHCWDLWPGPIQVACPQQTRNLLAAPVLALLALLLMVLALVERNVPVRCRSLRIDVSVLVDCIYDYISITSSTIDYPEQLFS